MTTIAEVRQPGSVSRSGGLIVDGLTTELSRRGQSFKIVDGVSFQIYPGEIVGLVGETGCGKTMTALSILQLLPQSVKVSGGTVRLGDLDLLALSPTALRRVRGDRISMVFQDPMASLDPAFTVGHQIVETVRAHRDTGTREARALAVDMLGRTGIPNPSQRFDSYPHQFSGGMRQRAMLAMALVLQPSLLIADEPTTALDVTIQAQILELIAELSQELAMSVLLITHNLGVVHEIADRAMVMYAGRDRGGVPRPADLRAAYAPLYTGSFAQHAAGVEPGQDAGGNTGPGPGPDPVTKGVPVCGALPQPDREMRRRTSHTDRR